MATTQQRQRTTFHVVTHDGKWVVRREHRPAGEYDAFETKDEAIARAQAEAQREMPSHVKVHHTDGSIEKEFSYS
ncbi:MAG: hypothetical protein DMD62_10295 [Gemmatimonadetes bacterium]|nr:MAG: hypothetical protein DMD62_10295 [Gemmatimonadota bacterium]